MAKKAKSGTSKKNLKKSEFDYENLLQTGKLAKIKRYQSYITRVAEGEKLLPAELKDMRILESEIEQEVNGEIREKTIFESNKEAAEYLGVSARMISYHLKRGNIRQNSDGTFDRKVLDGWLSKYRKKDIAKKGGNGSGDQEKSIDRQKEEAELRFRLARARREEMITDRMRGNLLSRKDVDETNALKVMIVKQGLLNFVERLSPILEKKTRKQIALILEKEINELLVAFAKKGEYGSSKNIIG